MSALPRARRLAALLESLVPLLTAAASENSQPPALRKAPKATVDKLPCRAYTAEEGVTRECYICLDTYEHGDKMRRLPCKHEFHAKCVDRWLLDCGANRRAVACPMCNTALDTRSCVRGRAPDHHAAHLPRWWEVAWARVRAAAR